jgi:hypothetical protein
MLTMLQTGGLYRISRHCPFKPMLEQNTESVQRVAPSSYH